MPMGKGTYGSKVGRPKKKKMMGGGMAKKKRMTYKKGGTQYESPTLKRGENIKLYQ